MAQSVVSIRMDEGLKTKFNNFCENVGMSMSTAICMFAKDTVRNQVLPFEVTTKKREKSDPFWSAENQARLRKSIAEMEKTGGTAHNLEELYDYLDK